MSDKFQRKRVIALTVEQLSKDTNFNTLSIPQPEREINGAYVGDLLSWVMGHGEEGQCLVTIMSNVNVLAVASLLDLSCVILAENVKPDDEFLSLAKEKGINILSSKESTYTICTLLYEALK